jgi:hypothetical protein
MFLRSLLGRVFTLLLPLTLTASVYLYLYPVFNGCGFPLPRAQSKGADGSSILARLQQNVVVNTFLQHLRTPDTASDNQPAIFRLLVLADPQLEGDSSLPLPDWKLVPRMRTHWRAVQEAVVEASTTTPLPKALLDQNVLDNIKTGLKTFATEDIPCSETTTISRTFTVPCSGGLDQRILQCWGIFWEANGLMMKSSHGAVSATGRGFSVVQNAWTMTLPRRASRMMIEYMSRCH